MFFLWEGIKRKKSSPLDQEQFQDFPQQRVPTNDREYQSNCLYFQKLHEHSVYFSGALDTT